MRITLAVALVLALAAAADARPYLRKPKPGKGFQVRVTPFTVDPSQDLEVCEYRRLPNRKPMDVTGMKLRMPAGAHHFVIWSYNGDITDDSRFPQGTVESVGCSGLAPDEFIPQVLIPIQTPNAIFRFPEGLALRIEPHQQVWLNPHMRNGTSEPIEPDVRFNFYKAKKGSVKHYVNGLIIGNITDIDIPAGGEQTLTAEWTAPVDMTMVQLATHQHRLGTYANIELVRAGGAPELLYENTDWEHPWSFWPNDYKGLNLVKGDKMRITCRWNNTDDHTVRFGPETTDEMCFILGFFYREDESEPIRSTQCVSAKRGLLCPLAPAVR
jgi:hypothetical protein